MSTPASTTPPLFYWDDTRNCYVQVPADADTLALRRLLDFDAMAGGQEVTLRFRRLDDSVGLR